MNANSFVPDLIWPRHGASSGPHMDIYIPDFGVISASSPLVGVGELNDNTIKGLTSLLSVE